MPCVVKSSFKPVYRSLSKAQSYTVDSHISFDKNWFSLFRSEITSFRIEPLNHQYPLLICRSKTAFKIKINQHTYHVS
jgi:hypothetical protein